MPGVITLRSMAGMPGPTGNDRIAGERAALRRVATLVGRAAAPETAFAAVTEEAGRLLGAHHATMSRYDPDGTATVVASWRSTGAAFPVGTRLLLGGRNAHTLVFQTHRAARIDDYADASGPTGKAAREFGFRASVSVPVSVEGGLWGLMVVEHTREEPLPADTEARLAGFTELAATAIANAEARLELRGFAEEQAGGDAGGPRGAAGRGVRRGHRGSRAAAAYRLREHEAVWPRRYGKPGCLVEPDRRWLPGRRPCKTRRAGPAHPDFPNPPARPGR